MNLSFVKVPTPNHLACYSSWTSGNAYTPEFSWVIRKKLREYFPTNLVSEIPHTNDKSFRIIFIDLDNAEEEEMFIFYANAGVFDP